VPEEELLIVKNVHSATSGRPPLLRTGEGYVSYFENDLREQWVFSMDWKSDVFFLAGGNIGWEERIIGEEGLKDFECGVPEQMWILACLYACALVDVAERVVAVWQDFEDRIRDYSSDAFSSPDAEQAAD
jgi:hypothetical protein